MYGERHVIMHPSGRKPAIPQVLPRSLIGETPREESPILMNASILCGDTIQPSVLSVDVYVLLMKTSISYLFMIFPSPRSQSHL